MQQQIFCFSVNTILDSHVLYIHPVTLWMESAGIWSSVVTGIRGGVAPWSCLAWFLLITKWSNLKITRLVQLFQYPRWTAACVSLLSTCFTPVIAQMLRLTCLLSWMLIVLDGMILMLYDRLMMIISSSSSSIWWYWWWWYDIDRYDRSYMIEWQRVGRLMLMAQIFSWSLWRRKVASILVQQ